jgi:hypothetical protein
VHYASAVKKIHLIEVRRQKPASLQIAGFFCLDFCQRQRSLQNQALVGSLPMLYTELSPRLCISCARSHGGRRAAGRFCRGTKPFGDHVLRLNRSCLPAAPVAGSDFARIAEALRAFLSVHRFDLDHAQAIQSPAGNILCCVASKSQEWHALLLTHYRICPRLMGDSGFMPGQYGRRFRPRIWAEQCEN